MKLVFCPLCADLFNLGEKRRSCWCGASHGKYLNHTDIRIGGKAVPVGIDNESFWKAYENQPKKGWGRKFKAFVIPKDCPEVGREA